MQEQLKHKDRLISDNGGVLDYVGEGGEILASVVVPPGIHRARPYIDATPEGTVLQVGAGLVVAGRKMGYGVQKHLNEDGGHDVGANPNYQPPGNAEQLERQMRLQVSRMAALNRATEARLRAFASVERIPVPSAQTAAAATATEGDAEVVE